MFGAVPEVPLGLQDNPKGVVYHIVQAHLGRNVTRNDLTWDIKETSNGQFVGQVSVPRLGLRKVSGEPMQNKKLMSSP